MWVSCAYYQLGRKITTNTPIDSNNTAITSTEYAGSTSIYTNAIGQTRTQIKGVHGKPIEVTDALGSKIVYQYDVVGNLIQTTAVDGNITTFTYDTLGNKTSITDPSLGTWYYTYNAFGELTQQTDAKGHTTTFTYDQLGRKIMRDEAEGVTKWHYDGENALGKLVTEQADNYSKSYSYDILGRIIKIKGDLDGNLFEIANSYDVILTLSSRAYPNNYQLIYIYNSYGYLQAIKTPRGEQVMAMMNST